MDCCYDGPQPLTAVAFRVHTHALGRLVWLDRLSRNSPARLQRVLQRSPLLPQGFNMVSEQGAARNPGAEAGGGDAYEPLPLPAPLVVAPGQRLRATCRFNASDAPSDVTAGPTSAHEMCNLYLLFYADVPASLSCYGPGSDMVHEFGPSALSPSPQAPLAALPAGFAPPATLGQVAGLAVAPDGLSLWAFQRGGRVWGAGTFGAGNVVTDQTASPGEAVLQLEAATGEVLRQWGAGLFNLPHGATVDAWGNVWVTDVGLHQARAGPRPARSAAAAVRRRPWAALPAPAPLGEVCPPCVCFSPETHGWVVAGAQVFARR